MAIHMYGADPSWTDLQKSAFLLLRSLKFLEAESGSQGEALAIADVWCCADRLKDFYQPHLQLPPRGQELWRDFEAGYMDAEGERSDLPRTIDRLCQWLIDEYNLETDPIETAQGPQAGVPEGEANNPPRKKSSKRGKRSESLAFQLKVALSMIHTGETYLPKSKPATQREIAELLKWDQPKVSRAMQSVFGKAGMKAYIETFRSEQWHRLARKWRTGGGGDGGASEKSEDEE